MEVGEERGEFQWFDSIFPSAQPSLHVWKLLLIFCLLCKGKMASGFAGSIFCQGFIISLMYKPEPRDSLTALPNDGDK